MRHSIFTAFPSGKLRARLERRDGGGNQWPARRSQTRVSHGQGGAERSFRLSDHGEDEQTHMAYTLLYWTGCFKTIV